MGMYNPADKEDRPTTHRGVYEFRITNAEDRTFSTGTEGIRITMDVFLPKDRVIVVYENLFHTPRALWKVEQVCKSVGLDFKTRPKAQDYVNRSGKAFLDRKKTSKFLEVAEFIEAGTGEGQSYAPPPPPPPPPREYPPEPEPEPDRPFPKDDFSF